MVTPSEDEKDSQNREEIHRSPLKPFSGWWGLIHGTERNGTERNCGLKHGTVAEP